MANPGSHRSYQLPSCFLTQWAPKAYSRKQTVPGGEDKWILWWRGVWMSQLSLQTLTLGTEPTLCHNFSQKAQDHISHGMVTPWSSHSWSCTKRCEHWALPSVPQISRRVTLGKSLLPSKPPFPQLSLSKDNNTWSPDHLICKVIQGSNKLLHIKYLTQDTRPGPHGALRSRSYLMMIMIMIMMEMVMMI